MVCVSTNFKILCDNVILLAGVNDLPPRLLTDPLELMTWEDKVRQIGDLGITRTGEVLDKVTYTTIRNWDGKNNLQGVTLFK